MSSSPPPRGSSPSPARPARAQSAESVEAPPRTPAITPSPTTEEGLRPQVVLVVAMGRNRVIGAAGGMPWHLPEDLRRFKALTLGHALVMGRATFEAIGRPLPGRRTIVVTRNPQWRANGVETAADLPHALSAAAQGGADPLAREIMVVGGGQIYAQSIGVADRLEVTEIDATPEGDTYFPAVDPALWTRSRCEPHDGFDFVTYTRRTPNATGRFDRCHDGRRDRP